MRGWMWPCALWLAAVPRLGNAGPVVIMPFEPAGATQQQSDMLSGYFRDAAQKVPGISVMTEAMTRDLVDQAMKSGWKLDLSPVALTRLTPMMQPDAYVTGHVSPDAVGLKVILRLIEAKAGAELKRLERSVLLTGTDGADGMRSAAVELLQPQLYRGAISVACAVQGVTVVLGTESLGTCNTALDIKDVVPGTHTLRLRKEGFAESQRRVEVLFDRTTLAHVEQTANGLVLEVEAETRAGGASMTLSTTATPTEPVATAKTPTPDDKKPADDGVKVNPLVYAGMGAVVAGAPIAIMGLALAIGASVLTGAWPRYSDGSVKPLFDGENAAMLQVRLFGPLVFIPVGLLVVLAGLATLAVGVGLAVFGLVKGE